MLLIEAVHNLRPVHKVPTQFDTESLRQAEARLGAGRDGPVDLGWVLSHCHTIKKDLSQQIRGLLSVRGEIHDTRRNILRDR
jgi:hypothetical protein